MFSKINKLEKKLENLLIALEKSSTKRYTANQFLKAENIHLSDGSNLTINMNNMLFSQEVVNECIQIVKELKQYLPISEETNLKVALNNYKNMITTKALEKSGGNKAKSAELLGITYRQLRYIEEKMEES
jgi:transcriptional regulator with PAS, ATPase and Fis domain